MVEFNQQFPEWVIRDLLQKDSLVDYIRLGHHCIIPDLPSYIACNIAYPYFDSGFPDLESFFQRNRDNPIHKPMEYCHIHIFVTSDMIVKSYILERVKQFLPNNRITIHVWKRAKDYVKLLQQSGILDCHPYIRICIDPDEIRFRIPHTHCGWLAVRYQMDHKAHSYWMQFQVQVDVTKHMDYQYYLKDVSGPINTRLRAEYPDFYQEELIQDFKKIYPKEILKSFHSDDDIWNYIRNQEM